MKVIDTNGNLKQILANAGPVFASPGGRLTLTSGTPVTTTDVTGATNIYYTPYSNGFISLWNGASWATISFTQVTLALGTLSNTTLYYVYGYLSGGSLALDAPSTTSATYKNGALCKSSDATRLLLGIFYTTATTTTEDSKLHRYLANQYNRVEKPAESNDGTNSRTTISSVYAQVGSVQIGFLSLGDYFILTEGQTCLQPQGATQSADLTIGSSASIEATGAMSAGVYGAADTAISVRASLSEIPALGLVTRYLLFASDGTGAKAYGDLNSTVTVATSQTFLRAQVKV